MCEDKTTKRYKKQGLKKECSMCREARNALFFEDQENLGANQNRNSAEKMALNDIKDMRMH